MAKERRRDLRWLTTAHTPREEEERWLTTAHTPREEERWLTTAHTPREEKEEQEWRKRMLELHLEPVGILDLVLRIGVRQRSPGGER